MKSLMLLGLCGLSLSMSSLSQASALKTVPAKLNPTKTYLILELKSLSDFAPPPILMIARYDRQAAEIRDDKRTKSSDPKDSPVHEVIAKNPLAKIKGSKLYLLELDPDDWVIEGVDGTSFSLGSYLMPLKAGELVDLGVLTSPMDWRPGEGQPKLTAGKVLSAALFGAFNKKPDPTPSKIAIRRRSTDDIQLPSTLVGFEVKRPVLERGFRFRNYMGGLVNRAEGRAGRPGSNLYEAMQDQREDKMEQSSSPLPQDQVSQPSSTAPLSAPSSMH